MVLNCEHLLAETVKYVSTKQSVCLISEDLMFYRDKVVLGKAKLLDDEGKIGVVHPKRGELNKEVRYGIGALQLSEGAKALAMACKIAYRILLTCSRM
jgi:hypothetical protein